MARERVEDLVNIIQGLNSILEKITRDFQLEQSSLQGDFIHGKVKGVYLVIQTPVDNSKINQVLESILHSGPTVIKTHGLEESHIMCKRTADILYRAVSTERCQKTIIVSIKYGPVIHERENECIAVVGTRYRKTETGFIEALKTNMLDKGIKIIQDRYEFGGGSLLYEIVRRFESVPDINIIEITLTDCIMEDAVRFEDFISVLSSL